MSRVEVVLNLEITEVGKDISLVGRQRNGMLLRRKNVEDLKKEVNVIVEDLFKRFEEQENNQ